MNRVLIIRKWHLIVIAILVAAALLRFVDLGSRPLHHDESIHAYYSWNLYRGAGYAYDPVYHGPFLYHANALIYFLFGTNDFTARILPAAAGVGIVILIFMLAPWIGRAGALGAAALAAFSPTMVYFSRFLRNDIYLAFFGLGTVVFFLRYLRDGRAKDILISAVFLALGFTAKENAYLLAFTFVSFLFILHPRRIIDHWLKRPLIPGLALAVLLAGVAGSQVSRAGGYFLASLGAVLLVLIMAPLAFRPGRTREVVIAFLAFAAIYLILYSTFFTNPRGILDGVFKALSYWSGQQRDPRIPGPFWYYLPRLLLYEVLAVIGLVSGFIKLRRRGEVGFFFLYWSAASLFLYALAQEKVPWLMVHQVLPMTIVAGWVIGEGFSSRKIRWPEAAVLAVLGLFTVHNAAGLAFWRGADPAESLVYVQTTPDVPRVVDMIEDYNFRHENNRSLQITVESENTWPFSWYLRDYRPGYPTRFNPDRPNSIIIASAAREQEVRQTLGDRYWIHRYRLRAWWLPDWSKSSLKEKARFILYREPFSGSGSVDFLLCLKKDDLDQKISVSPSIPPISLEERVGRPVTVYDDLNLSGPRDVAISGDRAWVVDTGHNRLIGLSLSGQENVVIGEKAGLNGPTGVAAGPGWVAVCDTWNHRVVIFNPDGTIQKILGPADEKGRSMYGPRDVVLWRDRWLVVDTGKHRVVVFNLAGNPIEEWDWRRLGQEPMVEPVGLGFDSNEGVVYAADTGNRKIRVANAAGLALTSWDVPAWLEYNTEPYLAVGPAGIIVASDAFTGALYQFSPDGRPTKKMVLDPSYGRWQPTGVTFADDGSLWVTDRLENRVFVFPAETEQ